MDIEPSLRRRIYRGRLFRVHVDAVHFRKLQAAAQVRGVEPLVLLDRIVETVIDANLIDAVLDDKSVG